ncbi:NAD-dependent epimerase/dehydratase family protein [Methylobacterium gossipiicola]|uniref:Nucleoside-diphosphate-sugar epimerase n=1 Tax=Methylobacterium gossipiicola TaxID=582675 RepID=A0A1I2RXJ3_9HYPH|nr:NAD(P)-dependent oxidoreductase [Methylobacterium gossipiicola]SFG44793.1 Nucleoside-diphosphate-sugar epimerase [Methylobacterium gossipiicola]
MRVLVTGASGFVGRHALAALAARGFEVHAVARKPLPGIKIHAVDLLHEGARRALVAAVAPSHLLHLAWDAEPGKYWTSAKNLDWVAASLDLARSFFEVGGRRLVVSGTCAEYEWGTDRFEEGTTPCRPATLYGAAKDGTHRILDAYAKSVGLSFAWGRLFYLYGPGERPGRLVSDAARALLAGEAFPTSPGHQARDFLHVVDAAGALAALLDGAVTGAVNIGSGTAVPVRTLLDGLADRTGRPDLLCYGAKALGPSEPAVIAAAITRLRDEVGFRPRFTLETGLDDTLAWWHAQQGSNPLS